MKNIIATSKTTDLIIQVTYMDKHITKGFVLVGDTFNKVGAVDYWSTSTLDIKGNMKEDPIVQKVVDSFQERSKVGIEKYGTTLEENNTDDFLEHLQQELMDATLYIQKLKEQNKNYNILLSKHNELISDFQKLETKKDSSVKDFPFNILYEELQFRGCVFDKVLNDYPQSEIVEYLRNNGYKVKYKL